MSWHYKKRGFVLIDALMAVLLLSCGVALLFKYQSQQAMMGIILVRQVETQQHLKCYHESRVAAKKTVSHPDGWRISDAPVTFSVKRCSFSVKELKGFCWQEIRFPWPEMGGISERCVVSGYAQE